MTDKVNYIPAARKFLIEEPHINPKTKGGVLKSEAQIQNEKMTLAGTPHRIVAAGTEVGYNTGDWVYISGQSFGYIKINDKVYLSIEGFSIEGKVENVEEFEKEYKALKEEAELKAEQEESRKKIIIEPPPKLNKIIN